MSFELQRKPPSPPRCCCCHEVPVRPQTDLREGANRGSTAWEEPLLFVPAPTTPRDTRHILQNKTVEIDVILPGSLSFVPFLFLFVTFCCYFPQLHFGNKHYFAKHLPNEIMSIKFRTFLSSFRRNNSA
jgi:hypothetical protein